MKKIREEIVNNNFMKWSTKFIDNYRGGRDG
jgi:hypothetical protein